MFEGKTINVIKPIGGNVAGQQKHYELWTQGGIITITDSKNVLAIDKTIKEAKRLKELYNININNYLQYMIDIEGILN